MGKWMYRLAYSRHRQLYPRERSHRYHRLGEPQNRSERRAEEKDLAPTGIPSPILRPSSPLPVAISTVIFRPIVIKSIKLSSGGCHRTQGAAVQFHDNRSNLMTHRYTTQSVLDATCEVLTAVTLKIPPGLLGCDTCASVDNYRCFGEARVEYGPLHSLNLSEYTETIRGTR
jgi:hypothetical protein